MLKPSYAELMNVLNENSKEDVTSRYTVVIAAAKRARQLVDGDDDMLASPVEGKPLSNAVEEIREGLVKVVPEGEGTKVKVKKKVVKDELKEEILRAEANKRLERRAAEQAEELDEEEFEDIDDTEEDFSDMDDEFSDDIEEE
ncbi:MAG: DNA-directed RNA polymerase subunit omega [Firmicutes bacterium]|nr:DNA-directed RNA polymerase subunit omega [Bacillota bacterium]